MEIVDAIVSAVIIAETSMIHPYPQVLPAFKEGSTVYVRLWSRNILLKFSSFPGLRVIIGYARIIGRIPYQTGIVGMDRGETIVCAQCDTSYLPCEVQILFRNGEYISAFQSYEDSFSIFVECIDDIPFEAVHLYHFPSSTVHAEQSFMCIEPYSMVVIGKDIANIVFLCVIVSLGEYAFMKFHLVNAFSFDVGID